MSRRRTVYFEDPEGWAMTTPKKRLGWAIAVMLGWGAAGTSLAEEVRPRFETRWILVKMKAPLFERTPAGTFSLATRRPEVDVAIVANEIHRIDHALSVAIHRVTEAAVLS